MCVSLCSIGLPRLVRYLVATVTYIKVNGQHCRDRDDEKVAYHLLVDTGSAGFSWVYSAQQPTVRIDEHQWFEQTHGWTEQQIAHEWATKAKIPPSPRDGVLRHEFGRQGDVSGTIVDATMTVVDLELHGLSGIRADDQDGIRDAALVSDFVLGAVGVNKLAFLYTEGADGVRAFGRCGTGFQPQVVRGVVSGTVQGILVRNKKLPSKEFWIRVAHRSFDQRGRDYMCLGRYHDPFGLFPLVSGRYTVLTVQPSSSHWKLYLNAITYLIPDENGGEPQVVENFRVDCDVIIDSSAAASWLPEAAVMKIQDFMKNHLGASRLGRVPIHMDPFHQVRFQFAETKTSPRQAVVGYARRFFVSQYENADGSLERQCDVRPVQKGETFLLGLNFLRTFMIGFHDTSRPSVTLVPQAHAN